MVPEEDQEDAEEIEKQPLDLEDMLELFRDDEEPKRKGFNPMWAVLALILVAVGSWLAVAGTEGLVAAMGGLKGKTPLPAKASERMPEPVLDVETAFRERCAKGMSKDEVRWGLEDFEKLGLFAEFESLKDIISKVLNAQPDQATPAERELVKKAILKNAQRGREWYAAALSEGLMPNGEQKAELKEKLSAALTADAEKLERFDAILLQIQQRPSSDGFPEKDLAELVELFPGLVHLDSFDFHMLYFYAAFPQMWLKSEAYAPWNLCQLSPDQLAVTNHAFVSAQHYENAKVEWMLAPEMVDAKGENLRLPHFLEEPSAVLPFTSDQTFPRDQDGIPLDELSFEALTKLHPAQFKLLLLCDLDMAARVRALLEKE